MTDTAHDPSAVRSGRYSALAVGLHWLIAAAILLQVVLASRMEGPQTPESFAVTQLHKSIGITILLLSLLRLAWRLANPPPPLPRPWRGGSGRCRSIIHVGFYVVMIGMPLTGWIMVSASRNALPILLYGHVPWPTCPGFGDWRRRRSGSGTTSVRMPTACRQGHLRPAGAARRRGAQAPALQPRRAGAGADGARRGVRALAGAQDPGHPAGVRRASSCSASSLTPPDPGVKPPPVAAPQGRPRSLRRRRRRGTQSRHHAAAEYVGPTQP